LSADRQAPVYRGDIEGLRALAVVPILLFHLKPSWCPGGYIGVDIFFVISGYLITRMILAEGEAFRFGRFCIRRFYRLFPALVVTLAVTLIAGWKLLPPSDYAALAKSAVAAFFGVSNTYFWTTIDYFDAGSYLHPLLHTWSLGVEAQFYLVWPTLIILAYRASLPLAATALAVAAISIAATVLFRDYAAEAAFYLMPFRMFEFAVGALAVSLGGRAARLPNWATVALGAIGLAVIVTAFAALDNHTPWPGAWTVAVSFATAALIIAGSGPVWGRAFSVAPARYLGRISYSLYLVHWPIITLYRHHAVTDPSLPELVAVGLASLAAGAALHALVEHPFRSFGQQKLLHADSATSSRPQLARSLRQSALYLVSAATLAGSAAIAATGGVPSRIDRERVATLDGGLSFGGDLCSTRASRCAIGDPSATQTVYLVGDSHALNLVHGLDRMLRNHGMKGIVLYDHGCPYLVGTVRFSKGIVDKKCRNNVADAFSILAANQHPVILAGAFAGYLSVVGNSDAAAPLRQTETEYAAWLGSKLVATLDKLDTANRTVVVIKQAYTAGIDLPKCRYSPTVDGRSPSCRTFARQDVDRVYGHADRAVDAAAAQFPGVRTLDPKDAFCTGPDGTCITEVQGELLLRDATHLTKAGSEFLASALQPSLLDAIRDRHRARPKRSRPDLEPR